MTKTTPPRRRLDRQKRLVTKPLEPVTDRAKLAQLRAVVYGIHSLAAAVRTLRLSNRLMARAMGEYRDGDKNYAPSTIAHWRHPRARLSVKMKATILEHAARVLDEWVKREAGSALASRVRFDMTVNSPWRCRLLVRCDCGHWELLDLRRRAWARCQACRKERR